MKRSIPGRSSIHLTCHPALKICSGRSSSFSQMAPEPGLLGRNLPLNRAILVNMDQFTLYADNQGRVMLPAWWRRKEGVGPSTELCVAVTEEGALVVETREQGLRRARALLRKYIPEGVNLSDELIAERRAEAARESKRRR